MTGDLNRLIFGKNPLGNIVAYEPNDDEAEIFFEINGEVSSVIRPNRYFALTPKKFSESIKLNGQQFYQYVNYFYTEEEWNNFKRWCYRNNVDFYSPRDPKECAMLDRGFTYFKNMQIQDVSVLAFDIETNGLNINDESYVYIIANTFRRNGKVYHELFSADNYKDQQSMLEDWCNWVRDVNPSVMLGHNIFTFDLPFLARVAENNGTNLSLGRDNSNIKFEEKESRFRKDGSQFYHYKRANIYGRNLIDTMFLAVKYDVGRKYDSYGLKQIIKQEGLEVKDRQFYDAGKIKDNWNNPFEREKIKRYAEFDGDDALALYDLMIAPYFYLTQSVPKTFQEILLSAPGSQINSMLVRGYFQDNYSIPLASPEREYQGAITIGNPGIYKHTIKVDINALYPSIIRQYQLHDKKKDPFGYFLKMTEYLTEERLKNKKLAKETGERYYRDLEGAEKIVANSLYGACGAGGLNFNSPRIAETITQKGREILQQSIKWAEDNGFILVNADTDSISITINEELTLETQNQIVNDLNKIMPEKIRFAHDGYYPNVLVVKEKNYALYDGQKLKIRGSALKATMKELALKEFLDKAINILMFDSEDKLVSLYNSYVSEILNITNISRWTSKKTVTDKILNPKRTNEQKILDAINGSDYKESDKIRVYFTKDHSLKLEEHWENDHDTITLLKKLYMTLEVLEPVIKLDQFPKYHLKRNQKLLDKSSIV